MVDREKVLSLLQKRFPEATLEQIAAAANGIVGLQDEWEELPGMHDEVARHLGRACGKTCALAADPHRGVEYRVFRRIES